MPQHTVYAASQITYVVPQHTVYAASQITYVVPQHTVYDASQITYVVPQHTVYDTSVLCPDSKPTTTANVCCGCHAVTVNVVTVEAEKNTK